MRNIKDNIRILSLFVMVVTGLIAVVISIYAVIYQFGNPELTRTQIIIYFGKKFWWNYLLFLISYLIYTHD